MSDELGIQLEVEFESYDKVNGKLETLLNQLKQNNINIGINFDSSLIQNNIKAVQDTVNNNKIKASIDLDTTELKNKAADINKIYSIDGAFDNFKELSNHIKELYSNIGETSVIANGVDQLDKFTVEVKKADGIVEKFKYRLDNETKQYKLIDIQHIDKTVEMLEKVAQKEQQIRQKINQENDKGIESTLNTLNRYEIALEKIKNSYSLKNGVNDESNLNSLNQRYNDIIATINRYKEANNTMSSEEKRNIDKQIADLKLLTTQYKDLEKTAEKGFNFQQYKDISGEVVKLKSAQDAYNTSLLEGNKVIKATVQETENYYKVTQELQKGNVFTNLNAYIDKATGKTYEFNRSVRDGMTDTLTLSKALSTAFTRFSQWLVSGTIVMSGIHAIKQAVSDVVTLDSQVHTLAITMEGTNAQFRQMGIEAQNLAIKYGTDVKSVMDVAAVYANMRESISSILSKTKASILLSTVSGLSTKQTTDGIHTVINQFDLAAEDAEKTSMKISDSLVSISKNMALNFGQGIDEIIKGIQVSGSVASSQAKLTQEEYSGILGAIVEKTRLSGEQVGNAMKTIMARIYQSKSIDPNVSDEELSKASKLYNELGIKIRNLDGSYRPLNEILKDINSHYSTLTDTQKANLAYVSAGVRQANIFTAAVSTVDKQIELTNAALNSNGEALEANTKYQDTAKAKWEQLKATLTSIAQQSLDSNNIKIFIGGITSLVNGIGEVVKVFGFLPSTIGTVSTAFFILNKNYREFLRSIKLTGLSAVKNKFSEWATLLNEVVKKTNDNIVTNKAAGDSITGLTTKLWAARAGVVAVKVASAALQATITMGLSIAIGFLAEQIGHLIHRQEELKQANQEVMQSYQQATKQNSDMISYLQNEGAQWDSLRNKTSLNTEEQKKMSEIKERLASQFPEMVVGIDSENKSILDQTKSTKDLIEALREKNKLENQKLMANGSKSLEETQKNLKDSNHELTKLKAQLDMLDKRPKVNTDYMQQGNSNVKYDTHNIEDMTAKVVQLKREQASGQNVTNELAKAEDELKKIQIERKNILSQIAVKEGEQKAKMSEFKPYINAIISEYEGLNEAQKKFAENSIQLKPDDLFKVEKGDYTSLIAQINDSISKIKNSAEFNKISILMQLDKKSIQEKDIKDYVSSIVKLAETTGKTPLELTKILPLSVDKNKIKQVIDNLIKEIEAQLAKATNDADKTSLNNLLGGLNNFKLTLTVDGVNEFNNAKDSLSDFNTIEQETIKAMDEHKSEMIDLNKVLDQHAASGEWNNQVIEKLLSKYPELEQYLGNDQEMTKYLTKLKDDLTKTVYARVDGEIDSYNKILDTYIDDISAYDQKEQSKTQIAAQEQTKRLQILREGDTGFMGMNNMESRMNELSAKWKSGQLTEAEASEFSGLQTGAMYVSNQIAGIEESIKRINNIGGKIADLEGMKKRVGNFYKNIGDSDHDGKKNKEPKHQKSAEDIKDLDMKVDKYLSYEQAIKSVENELAKSKSLEESLKDDKLIKQKEYDIELMTQKATLLDQLHNKQKTDMEASSGLLNKLGFNAKDGTINNYRERLEEEIANANSQTDVKKKKDAQEHVKNLEAEIKKYFELSKAVSDNRVQHEQLVNEVRKLHTEIMNLNIEAIGKAFDTSNDKLKEKLADLDLKELTLNDDNDIDGQLEILDKHKELVQQQIDAKAAQMEALTHVPAISEEDKKKLDTDYKKAQDELRDYQKSLLQLNKTLKDTQDKKIKLMEDVESKITDMLKKQAEERKKVVEKEFEDKKKAIEDEYKTRVEYWQKVKKLYNSENTEDDRKKELSASQGDLDKLRQDYQTSLRDNSEAGKLKTEQLRKAIEDQEKKINDLITKQERERHNEYLDENISREEKEKASKVEGIENDKKQALDDIDTQWSSSKIADVVKEAMQTGFFTDVEGKVQNVKEAYGEFLDKFENGTSMAGQKLKEDFIKNFDVATNSVKDLDKTHTEMSKTVDTNTTKTGENIKTNLNDNLTKTDTTIKEITTSSETFTSTFTNGIDGLNQNITGVFIPNLEKIKDLVGSIDMSKLGIGGISSTKVTLPQTSNISSIANNIQNVRNNQPTTLKTDVHFSFGDVKTNLNDEQILSLVSRNKEKIADIVDEGISNLNYRR